MKNREKNLIYNNNAKQLNVHCALLSSRTFYTENIRLNLFFNESGSIHQNIPDESLNLCIFKKFS